MNKSVDQRKKKEKKKEGTNKRTNWTNERNEGTQLNERTKQ